VSEGLKLQLIFKDRVGIIADLTTILGERAINILSMEVDACGEKTFIYFETHPEAGDSVHVLIQKLKTIHGLIDISPIKTLPQEKREKSLKVMLNSVSDGIVAIDDNGKVLAVNRVAKRILGCSDPAIVGKPVENLNLPDYLIRECLHGKQYRNIKRTSRTASGLFHFFASGQPFKDSNNRIVGAVEVMKDMKEIKELADAVSNPTRITFSDILGKSPCITSAIAFARQVARSNAIISIRGKSGTGKELFARAIHHSSGLSGLFLPINCAALPEHLLESELFGYEPGTFTGADRHGKSGLFEKAKDGTIFLDEIAEMSPSSQAKLLRVLQERRVRRIGGARELPINARVITATSRNMEEMVNQDKFRDDLYYRINVLPIYLPSLQERIEDIPLLAEHFLFHLSYKLNKDSQPLCPGALEKLCGHDWPGNIRELRNVIERAAILAGDSRIEKEHILFSFETDRRRHRLSQAPATEGSVLGLKSLMQEHEKQVIRKTLVRYPSIRQCAKALQLSHTALINKIKKYGLRMERK